MTLKIEYLQIDMIKPYEGNAKEHSPEQIAQIVKSIQEFGNCDPIGVWHNEIVEGHGRYLALKELGVSEIPVIKLDHLSEEQRRAYALVHNKLTMNTGFDLELLAKELENINEIDMTDFSFDFNIEDTERIDEINSQLDNFDHIMKIDNTKIVLTNEEYEGIMQKYTDYVAENGVAFGFVGALLND